MTGKEEAAWKRWEDGRTCSCSLRQSILIVFLETALGVEANTMDILSVDCLDAPRL